MSGTGQIVQAASEEIHPGCCNAYTEHFFIKKYLEGISL